jgi:uncharacterized protein
MKLEKLTDNELDRLDAQLKALNPDGMNIEALDGYLFALHCVPELVMPSQFLKEIIGAGMFEKNADAAAFSTLIFRHWNFIGAELDRTLVENDIYEPVLIEDKESGITCANDWAEAFMHGLSTQPAALRQILSDEEGGGCMVPIMLFANEHNKDPALRATPIAAEKRGELLMHLIAGAHGVYRYFEAQRQDSAVEMTVNPIRRGVKVGRNEPCPCGSGKKYKHCCIGSAPTLH